MRRGCSEPGCPNVSTCDRHPPRGGWAAWKRRNPAAGLAYTGDWPAIRRRVLADEPLPDPSNWRRHPPAQATALRSMLEQVGFADALLARETPEGLRLIDGHLRAGLTPEETVPVLVLDLDEAEAGAVLATLDPLAAMAAVDQEALRVLLAEVSLPEGEVTDMLARLTPATPTLGLTDPDEI